MTSRNMNTPICDFVKSYTAFDAVRAHMPGHKGRGKLGIENKDITEIDGADVLYYGNGIIKESELNARKLFNTAKTLYSAEGSSLSIRAMLFMIKKYSLFHNKQPSILACRNAHKVFTSCCALLGIDVDYILPQERNYVSAVVFPEALEAKLSEATEKPTAVYITSPDYLGNISDISGISRVCKKYGIILVVDNAHGAYLNFLEKNIHPIALGADLCCDSAHKTLFALTGGGYLHISKSAPSFFAQSAESAITYFSSTSPSYLILQSLDAQNPYLSDKFSADLAKTVKKISKLKQILIKQGYSLLGNEALKIAIDCKKYGYTGYEISEILKENNVYSEFCDRDFAVLMLSVNNRDKDFEIISDALCGIKKREYKGDAFAPPISTPISAVSPQSALFSKSEIIDIKDSEGRILADISVSCPPAVEIVKLGEKIDRQAIKAFEYYGINKVTVVKQ